MTELCIYLYAGRVKIHSEMITASMLYNFVQCPHRVTLDLFGSLEERDDVSAFVELLWERGNAFESNMIEDAEEPFLNLKNKPTGEKLRLTSEAMAAGEKLIYGGRIAADDLLGEPDLLRRMDRGYIPGDIKSGSATEHGNEDDDQKPKKHYVVQLALYTDILRRNGHISDGCPFVWDIHGDEVMYNLDLPRGPRIPMTMWEEYQEALASVQKIASQKMNTTGAWASSCKQCHWRTKCKMQLVDADDLTLIPELGRSRREKLSPLFRSVGELASADIGTFICGSKTSIPGIGANVLARFHARACLQKEQDPQPYMVESVIIPGDRLDLFFDVETDPMRGVCYLHGFVERTGGNPSTERYISFFADNPSAEAEKAAFAAAWDYVKSRNYSSLFYYSPYERTTWRKLAEKYPEITNASEVDEIFACDSAFDLYHDLVRTKMMWPTQGLGIKDIATFLGFEWRDTEPSGAASIQWYHHWEESGDSDVRQRILEYNEDDCLAMRVLVDFARHLIV